MSPAGWYAAYNYLDSSYSYVFVVCRSGTIDDFPYSSGTGVRPVINLKANAIKYGTGTSSDPYRVTEN